MSAPLVLVHGGGHGAWCWEPTLCHLASPALAVDLPPRSIRGGPHRHASPPELDRVTLSDWARSVLSDATAAGWERFVLVGHSLGGATLATVSRLAPSRVAHVVYVSAVVPADGASVLDALPPEILTKTAAGLTDEVVVDLFGSDMDEGQVRFLLDHVGTDAVGVLAEAVVRSGTPRGLPTTFVRLARDRALPPAVQDVYAERLRGGADAMEVIELDAGHDVMISRPAELAAVLDRIAARV